MKTDLAEIIFLLDRSGSMSGLESDAIGGYNSFLATQKIVEGKAQVTTVLFDDKYDLLHDGVDIENVKAITEKEYFARGSTALLDAIGKTIINVGIRLSNTVESERPSKVIFVITTDGQENASREFSYKKIHEMISEQQDKYSWEFIFLGANIDAAKEAESLGIKASRASNYVADSLGTDIMYCTVAANVASFRQTGNLGGNLSEAINKNTNKKNKGIRGINERFIKDLNTGILKDFLVFVKNNKELCLEIRRNYINIYYKGGNLLKITQTAKDYTFHFDSKYCKNKGDDSNFDYVKSLDKKNALVWITEFSLLMKEMDSWFECRPKAEREFQHNLIKANDGTDSNVFILDIEFAGWTKENKLFKLDMLGLFKTGDGYKLIIFENKYGGGAIGGKAGVNKHYNDIVSIINYAPSRENLVASVINIANNKADLGLCNIINNTDITEIEILFLIVEFNPNSMAIKNAVEKIYKSIAAKIIFMSKEEIIIEYEKAKDLWKF